MLELCYISDKDRGMSREAIEDILWTSIRKNRDNNVSGCLAVGETYFVQIIEGDPERIENLIETIKSDPRHSNVEVLWREEIEDRCFPNWHMAYVKNESLVEALESSTSSDARAEIEQMKPDDLNNLLHRGVLLGGGVMVGIDASSAGAV